MHPLARSLAGALLGLLIGIAARPLGDATAASSPPQAPASLAHGPAAGDRDYVAEVRANFTPESRAYATTRAALRAAAPFYAVLVAAVLLFSGLSARMRDVAHARSRGRYGRVLVYLALFMLAGFVLEFPLAWYGGFVLEHQYRLSNQTFGAWLGEQGKDLLVGIAVYGLTGLASLAYLAIEQSPRRWWLHIGVGALPVILAGTLLQPLVVDPLYNKFTPLRDEALRGRIVALAAEAGIPGRRVYEVDKSRQTRKYNAYVSGFGASQRIVLWDTMLRGMREDEILFVMGHEMGHYRLAHIWKGVLFYWLLIGGLLFLAWLLAGRAIAAFGPRWGIRELHDVASLPLLVAIVTVLAFLARPVTNGFSRTIEHEADVFALEVTRANDAGARAFIALGSQNRADPEPPELVKHFQYTHPPLVERIRFALGYRPWEEGRPNRAFRPPG